VAVSATLTRRTEPLPLATVVRAGVVLASQGEHSTMAWRVEDGALWETVVLPDGRALALGILGPGDAIGEPDGIPSASTVRSLRVSRLRPMVPSDAADLFAARARRAASLAAELAWCDVPSRLLSRLRDLTARFGRPVVDGRAISFRISQDQLALLCGSSRETVSRSLRALAEDGRIRVEGRGRYVVLDDPAPAEIPLFGRPGVPRRPDFRPADGSSRPNGDQEPAVSCRTARLHGPHSRARPFTGRPHRSQVRGADT
jgi:CRP/FNR family transcriptional regulator